MTGPRILIAGATGSNGRALITTLSEKAVRLRALVRNTEAAAEVLPGHVEIVAGDLSHPESMRSAFDGVDRAYVVTAVHPQTVTLFDNFYAAAKQAGVKQLVKFSGLGASTASSSEIIRQHGESDDRLRASGIPYTILRPNSFHQNMLWQAAAIAATDTFYLPVGDAAQSTIDVRDIAEITATILTSDAHMNRSYDLTGPQSLTFHDVAQIIGRLRGRPVSYVPISPEVAERSMKEQGLPDWAAHALAEIQALFGTGAYADVLPDTARLLGRSPRNFEAFAQDHLSHFLQA